MAWVTEFVISRKKWARGVRGLMDEPNYLLRRSDGTQCCLGIYMTACGVPDTLLRGKNRPDVVKLAEGFDPLPTWLWSKPLMPRSPTVVGQLISVNDRAFCSETEREAAIRAGFAEAGITVTFED